MSNNVLELNIKGATFKVAPIRTKTGELTGDYKFLNYGEFVNNNPENEFIGVGYDTVPSDFKEFEEAHGVEFVCNSVYSEGGRKPRFVKQEDL